MVVAAVAFARAARVTCRRFERDVEVGQQRGDFRRLQDGPFHQQHRPRVWNKRGVGLDEELDLLARQAERSRLIARDIKTVRQKWGVLPHAKLHLNPNALCVWRLCVEHYPNSNLRSTTMFRFLCFCTDASQLGGRPA